MNVFLQERLKMKLPGWLLLIVALLFSSSLCAQEAALIVENGKNVKLNYIMKVDGAVVDSTHDREPLEFVYGKDTMMLGIVEGIAGLKAGDKKELTVLPEKGFGPVDAGAVIEVPKDKFKKGDVKEGMMFRSTGNGESIMGTVIKVNEKTIVMDFNHPLAGKTLNLDIEILEVSPAVAEPTPDHS